MNLLSRLLCVAFLLIGISTTIQSEKSDQFGSPVDFVQISEKSSVKFGQGIKSTHFPVIEYPSHGWYESSQILNSTVYTRRHRCQLPITISENMSQTDAKTIWQLTDNKVIIVWNVFEISKRPKSPELIVAFVTKVTPLNMKTCQSGKSVRIPWDLTNDKNFVEIVPYKSGFDVISSVELANSRTRYDADGNLIGEPRVFKVDVAPDNIQPASTVSRSKGLFVINKNHTVYELILTKANGKVVKRLLEFKASQIITNLDQMNYTVCWSNVHPAKTMTVECMQFDDSGVENFRGKKNFAGLKQLLDVKNLNDGGILLFALNEDGNELEVTAMRSDLGDMTSTYNLRSAVLTDFKKFVEFEEEAGDFVFAYVHHNNDQHRVIQRKYHLMNWHE